MHKRQQRVKSFLKTINYEQHWYTISIEFDNSKFFRKLYSVSDFYKRISNSKASLTGNLSNRAWWRKIKPQGFYYSEISQSSLIINFVVVTKVVINETEIKSRFIKICPYQNFHLTYKKTENIELLNSNNYFVYNSSIELFGDSKR